jgi:diadenosine tetraphosphate (Ap4A) HIT family hydrolase
LVIPKHHAAKLHDVPAAVLQDVMLLVHQVSQQLVSRLGVLDYNILQNNGRLAHQVNAFALYFV